MTLFCVYMVIISSITSFILISGKMDGEFEMPWTEVFIPVWISCALLVIYSFFMCPGLIDSTVALYRQAFLFILYSLAMLVFSILAGVKLEQDTNTAWSVIL